MARLALSKTLGTAAHQGTHTSSSPEAQSDLCVSREVAHRVGHVHHSHLRRASGRHALMVGAPVCLCASSCRQHAKTYFLANHPNKDVGFRSKEHSLSFILYPNVFCSACKKCSAETLLHKQRNMCSMLLCERSMQRWPASQVSSHVCHTSLHFPHSFAGIPWAAGETVTSLPAWTGRSRTEHGRHWGAG